MEMTRYPGGKAVSALLFAASFAGSLILAGYAAQARSADASNQAMHAKLAPPAILEAGQLSVCTALGLGAKPLFYFDTDMKPSGLAVEFATAFAAKLGLKYKAVSTAFPSLIPSLQAGKCDVIMSSLFITPTREQQVAFVPYLLSAGTFVAAPGNPRHITGMNDSLCGLKVATTVGQSAIATIEEQSKKCAAAGKREIELTQLNSSAAGQQMVANRQVDAFMATVADLVYAAAHSNGTYEVAGEPFRPVVIGAAVRKDNVALKDAIQQAFDAVRADGTYTKLLDQYGLGKLALPK